MWIRSYNKIYPDIKKEDVWRVWMDVNNWPKWQEDLDYCKLEGQFIVGNYFMLKPKGAPAFKIELTEIENYRKFTDCTKFFGARMYDIHELEETKEGLRISNTLTVTGPLKFLWIKLVAQNVAASIPQQTEALVNFVRATNV